jgi:DNA helicase HerA-like ATPase
VHEEKDSTVTYLGKVNARGRGTPFGIKRADRRSHMYVIGRTGTGKSTLLATMIRQDIENGEGLAVFDPHGDLVDNILRRGTTRTDLLSLDLSRPNLDVGFNPLEGIPEEKRPLAAANLVEIFKKIWSDSWGPRLEHILRNAILALLDKEGATLADIPRLFGDGAFRSAVSRSIRNPQVRFFWTGEYERYPLLPLR